MSFLNHLGQPVVIIHGEGTPDETRTEAQANVQPDKGFFAVSTPIYQGDVVELPDPRGGSRRLKVAKVDIFDAGPQMSAVNHIEVIWEASTS